MANKPGNAEIAAVLERIAELLEIQDANPFRVRAYRDGAQTIRELDKPVAELVQQNRTKALTALPNIGDALAAIISDYVTFGNSDLLDELEAEMSPEDTFRQVPGIGKELSARIVEQLNIHTLAELEEAAHDGRLAEVEGFGRRRVKGVQAALAGMFSRSARRTQQDRRLKEGNRELERPPSVETLLEIDAEYRHRAEAGKLQKIAPRRFNPDDKAWLPILHTERGPWKFTALYSNTAQAHELGKTHDWVVIYYERYGKERQNTVVTAQQGPLKGHRVVRGREKETREYYKTSEQGQ